MSYANDKSLIPVFGQQNLAPLKPLLELRNGVQKPGHYICDALKERFQNYMERDKSVRNEMVNVGQEIALFIEGKQLTARDPFTGGIRILVPDREDETTQRALNVMQFWTTNWITKYLSSNPNVIVRPGIDTEQSAFASKGADVIVDHFEHKFYKPWFSQQEALLVLSFGTYLQKISYDPGIKGILGVRQIIEDRTIQIGEGSGFCGACGHQGMAGEFQAQAPPEEDMAMMGMMGEDPMQMMQSPMGAFQSCPKCGSEAVSVIPPAIGTVPTVVGEEQVEMGDLRCDTLPFPACWWDLHYRAEESPYFIYRQRISVARVRATVGNIRIPGDGAQSDTGLNVIDALAKSGQALAGYSAHGFRRRDRGAGDYCTLDEMWMTPDEYADIRTRGDEQTIAGITIPQDVSLAEVFPNGLVAVGLNGMRVVLGIYPERHADHLVSGVYHMKPLSGAGRGAADGVEIQRRLNKFDSQAINYMDAVATPAILHDNNLIDEDEVQYLGHPRAQIAVDLSQLPPTRKLADAVHAMQPGSLPAQFVQYTQDFLKDMFQLSFHITNFSGGLPGTNNRTATGAQITDFNAQAIFIPVLQLKAAARVRGAELTVNLYRKHFPLDRYFPLGGKHGETMGMRLNASQLEGELIFDYEQDSELPKNNYTKREDIAAFFMLFGGFDGYMQALEADPVLVTEIARLHNVRIGSRDVNVAAKRCQTRIDQMQMAQKMANQMAMRIAQMQMAPQVPLSGFAPALPPGDPMAAMSQMGMPMMDPMMLIAAIQPPVSRFEPNHLDKAKWLSDWLDTDDALDPNNLALRMAVEILIQMHFSFGAEVMVAVASAGGMAQQAAAGGPQGQQQESKNGPPRQQRPLAMAA